MLKVYTVIYCILLALLLLFMIAASFLVGVAGHNTPFKTSDYLLFLFIVTTIISLIIDIRVPAFRLFKYFNAALVLTGALTVTYTLIEMLREGDFIFILIVCQLLFLILSFYLIRAILKK